MALHHLLESRVVFYGTVLTSLRHGRSVVTVHARALCGSRARVFGLGPASSLRFRTSCTAQPHSGSESHGPVRKQSPPAREQQKERVYLRESPPPKTFLFFLLCTLP